MFRAAFLRKVPLFVRNFAENVLLCALAAGVESTSRRFLERLKLFWRAKLTDRIHRQYFSSMVHPRRACRDCIMYSRWFACPTMSPSCTWHGCSTWAAWAWIVQRPHALRHDPASASPPC